MAGRPRKPTNVLEMTGAFKKNPDRLKERENEPQNINPVGDPPESLSKEAKSAWAEIVENSIPGVLGQADRVALEMASSLLVRCRGVEHEDEGKIEIIYASSAEQNLLFKYLSQFGMTPADRSKINVPKEKPKNKFND